MPCAMLGCLDSASGVRNAGGDIASATSADAALAYLLIALIIAGVVIGGGRRGGRQQRRLRRQRLDPV
jgi:hypothetical protein